MLQENEIRLDLTKVRSLVLGDRFRCSYLSKMEQFIVQLEKEVAAFANKKGKSLDAIFYDLELDRPNFNKAKQGKVKLEWSAFEILLAHTSPDSQPGLKEGYVAYRDQREALSRKGGPSNRQLENIGSLPKGSLKALADEFSADMPACFDYHAFKSLVDQTLNAARRAGHTAKARRSFYVIAGSANDVDFTSEADRLYSLTYAAHIGRYAGYQSGDLALADAAQRLAHRLRIEDQGDPILQANLVHIAAFRALVTGSDDYDLHINEKRRRLLERMVQEVAPGQRTARAEPTNRALMEFILRSDLARAEARTLTPDEVREQQKLFLEIAAANDQISDEQMLISERRVAEAELYRGSAESAAELFGETLTRISTLPADIPDWLIGSTHRMRAEALIKVADQSDQPHDLLVSANRHCGLALHHFSEAQGVVFMRETQALKRQLEKRLR